MDNLVEFAGLVSVVAFAYSTIYSAWLDYRTAKALAEHERIIRRIEERFGDSPDYTE